MPGMATSRTRHLVSAIDSEARNSSADENVCASKPNSFSKSGKDSRTDSSSSTTVIRGRLGISSDSPLTFSTIERLPRMRLIKAGFLSYFGMGLDRDKYQVSDRYFGVIDCIVTCD